MMVPCRFTALAVAVACVLAHPAAADTVSIGAARDNTLIESGSGGASNGAGSHLHVGLTEQPSRRRGLIAFDIAASVPPGSVIESVTMTLFMSRSISGPATVSLHAALADWGEGTSDAPGNEGGGAPATPGDATWLHTFFDTDLWSSSGGDFAASPSTSTAIAGVGSYTFGSTPAMVSDVQSWLDDPSAAYGWLLIGDESASPSAKRFDTKENALADRRPLLTVEFTPPNGRTNEYYADADDDGFGNPAASIESPDPRPPLGFVVDNTDCDDTDPDVNPGADEVCDNGVDDDCNGLIDDCSADCNGNGVPDFLELLTNTSLDCNSNGILDSCDVAAGTADDINGNFIPDACELSCCGQEDLRSLTLQYTTLSCIATTHGQDDGDVTCTDFGPLPDTALVLVTDEEDPFDRDARVWFQGVVGPGEMFIADAANAGEGELGSRTSIHVLSSDGVMLLQSVEFRTGCSDPLAIGDQFGASLLVGCLGSGQSPPCPPDLDGDGQVDADDLIAVILAWGTGDPRADVTNDGVVAVDDLLAVITFWGPCPS